MSAILKKSDTVAHQIFWLVAKTTMFGVLVVAATNIVSHVFATREAKVGQIHAISDVIAQNTTAAVSFDTPEAATELLSSLTSRPSVTEAFIIDSSGNLFASYSKHGATLATAPTDLSQGQSFSNNQLEIRTPIIEFEQKIGTLIIRSDTVDIQRSVVRFIATSCLFSLFALVVGLWLASKLQRTISNPIKELAQTAQEISGKGDYSLRVEDKFTGEIGILCQHFNVMLHKIEIAKLLATDAHEKLLASNEDLEDRVRTRTRELAYANEDLHEKIKDKMRAHQELKDLQGQLIDTSRQAGMAEIANGVLHNVGNVLNSVNVSATIIDETINEMRIGSLEKASNLLLDHKDDLGGYFTHDKRAQHFPNFLDNMVEHFKSTQQATITEVQSLNKNIGFIKDVIQAQQSFAGHCGVISTVRTDEIFDDALRFVSSSFIKHCIDVEKRYEIAVEIQVDKSKLLQILTNFIKNAREAMAANGTQDKAVVLTICPSENGMIAFSVKDNGMGIEPENIKRIFNHGFTTKTHGHGFGLHSSAIAAKQMNGAVRVESDGKGLGATFTVEVPRHDKAPRIPALEVSFDTASSTIPTKSP